MNTFYLFILLKTISVTFSSKNTNFPNLPNRQSQYCLIGSLINPAKKFFQYHISIFLLSEDLVKIYNLFQAQKKCNKIKNCFPNLQWKTYVLIQPEQGKKILYDLLEDEKFDRRLILFCEKTKTASTLNNNFKGSDANWVTIVSDDIVPFDPFVFHYGNTKRIMIAKTQKKYTLVLINEKKEFSTICFGTYFFKNDTESPIVLQNEDQEIEFPDDFEFLSKAKQSKKIRIFVKILFWNKGFIQNYFKIIKFYFSPFHLKFAFYFALTEYLVDGDVSTINNLFLCAYYHIDNIFLSFIVAAIFPYLLPVSPFLLSYLFYLNPIQFIKTTLLFPLIPLSVAFHLFLYHLELPNISLPLSEREMISTCALIHNIHNLDLKCQPIRDFLLIDELIIYFIQIFIFLLVFQIFS